MRIWERLRRPKLRAFFDATRRPFFAFQKGQSCVDVVWRQAVRADTLVVHGDYVAALACDGEKFYEHFDLEVLRARALAWGIPGPFVKLTYNVWRGPRVIKLGAHVHDALYHALSGLPAGSGFNDAFVRASCIDGLGNLAALHPAITIDQAIDDSVVIATGSFERVRADIKRAARDQKAMIEVDIGGAMAAGKTAITASDPRLARSIAHDLRQLLPNASGCFPNLGIDFQPGRRGAGKSRKRWQRAVARNKKLRVMYLLTANVRNPENWHQACPGI